MKHGIPAIMLPLSISLYCILSCVLPQSVQAQEVEQPTAVSQPVTNAVASSQPHAVTVNLLQSRFLVGEPIHFIVGLHNGSDAPVTVHSVENSISVSVLRPDGKKSFGGWTYCDTKPIVIPAQGTLWHKRDLNDYPHLDTPGTYTVIVRVLGTKVGPKGSVTSSGRTAETVETTFEIVEPTGDDAACLDWIRLTAERDAAKAESPEAKERISRIPIQMVTRYATTIAHHFPATAYGRYARYYQAQNALSVGKTPGRMRQAIGVYRQIIKETPNSPLSLLCQLNEAEFRSEMGEQEEALSLYKELGRSSSAFATAQARQGIARLTEGSPSSDTPSSEIR